MVLAFPSRRLDETHHIIPLSQIRGGRVTPANPCVLVERHVLRKSQDSSPQKKRWACQLQGEDVIKAKGLMVQLDGIDDSVGLSIGIHFYETDNDGDGLSNAEELELGTDLLLADTDGDGVNDNIDALPTDPSASSTGSSNPTDMTAPSIILRKPPEAMILE